MPGSNPRNGKLLTRGGIWPSRRDSNFPFATLKADMPHDVVVSNETTALEDLAGRTRTFMEAAKAENSRRAYRSDWRQFESWCRSRGLASLPARADPVA